MSQQWVVIHNADDGYAGVTGLFESKEVAIESILTDPGVVDYAFFDIEDAPTRLELDSLPEGWEVEDPDPMEGWFMRTDIWSWQVTPLQPNPHTNKEHTS